MSSNLFLYRSEITTLNVTICTHLLTLCILYNKRDATYTMFFIIISALHVSGGFSAHHQELINCKCSFGYCHAFLLSTADVEGFFFFFL